MQKIKNIFSLLVFLLFLSPYLTAQKESMIWYFGRNLGFDFHTDPPTQLYNANSRFNGFTGSAAICDPHGNLKFYTDGIRVFNNTHQVMKNGGIKNGTDYSLRTLIVPKPNNPGIYYIFTISYSYPTKLEYCIVDMNKDTGLGEVVSKNNFLMDTASYKLTAVKHSNGQSLWLLTCTHDASVYYAYEITSSGIQPPVKSKCSKLNLLPSHANWGVLKLSPDNKYLVSAYQDNGSLEYFNFNASTGVIKYNFGIFDNEDYFGVEFSPDISKMYVTTVGWPLPRYLIWQFDLKAGDSTSIKNSKTYIGRSFNSGIIGGCQLAIDGKIYIANNGTHIGRINNPNEKGYKCNYDSTCFPGFKPIDRVTSLMGYDFPDFIQSYFFIPDFTDQNTCFGDTTFFSLTDSAYIDSVLWCFDDSLSGQSNFSKINTPYHIFSDTGLFNVSVVVYHDTAKADTLLREIRISPYPSAAFVINDSSQCFNNNVFQFSDTSSIISGSFNWEWDFGDSNRLFVQNPVHSYSQADTFEVRLTVLSDYGCKSSVSKKVYVLPSPKAGISINDSAQCFNQNSFMFLNPWGFGNPKGLKMWDFGDGKTSNSDTASHSYANADTFQITLIEETDFGCRDTAIKNVIVHPSPKANFSFNDSVKCFNEQMLVARNSSLVDRDSIAESKWVLNSDTVISMDLENYAFSNQGSYPIQLIVSTLNNCRDTLVKDFVVHPSPQANFEFNDSTQCFNTQFLDARNSSLAVGDSIMENLWYLDQDTLKTEDIVGYKFNNFGTYPVKLVVATSNNCRDSITKNVEIYEAPIAVFSINDSSQCFNENNFKLTNQSQYSDLSKLNHWWDLGDMTIVNNPDVTHTYSTVDTFTITLETQTPKGCKDKLSKQVVVLPSPKAVFSLNDSVQCFNEQSLVARNSSLVSGDSIVETKWILNSDTILSNEITNYQFTQPGTYPIQLIVNTSNNCPDTLTSYFILHPSPNIDFAINDSTQCLKSNSFDFTNLSTIQSGTMDFQWYTNNQNFQSFNLSTFNYPQWGKYPVSQTATSNQNCKDSLTKYIYIYPNPVSAFVYLNNCLEDTMYFYDSSYVDSGMIAQWYWNFGDTNRSTMKDPTNIYQTPGQFGVILTTTTDQGCTDDSTRFFKIHPHVSPNEIVRATVENDETILLEWLPPDEGKPETYTLEKSEDGLSWFELSTFNEDEFSYEDYSVWVDDRPYWYRMNVTDSCQYTSDYSNIGKSILLKVDNTQLSPQLTWTAYQEWANGIETYELQIQKDGEFHNLQSFNFSTFNYIDSTTKINETEYCYRIVAYQSNSDVVSVSNVVCIPTEFHIFAPNSFTPNGDGTNDIFKAIGTYILDYQLIIYDRWGTKLFETTDITKGWDGTYKNQPCPMDAYYFYINAQGTGSQRESIKGTVMLLR
jgi:gliding motility-associated-like protein